MPNKKRVVITGVGPLASVGIGKEDFWKGILNKQTGLRFKELKLDEEIWDSFYVHEMDDFNISKFNIDEIILEDIKAWKRETEDRDLFSMIGTRIISDCF
jgi:3-oxoacyl-(acyl-carrier-protein) synthase